MSDMWSMVAGLGGQYRWAAAQQAPQVPAAPAVLVVGMGGSGISGDFAAVVAASHGVQLTVHKGYGLPDWAPGARPLVVAVSYSGNTEETLEAVQRATAAGLPMAVVSSGGMLGARARDEGWPLIEVPGGLQPRAAAGYLIGAVLRVLEGAALVPGQPPDLEEAAATVDELLGESGQGPGHALARDLAEGLAGRVVVAYGSTGGPAVAAQRWKTQINENAKSPAFWSQLPELDHNEIEGWAALAELTRTRFGIVLLRDRDEHPQIRRRFEVSADLIKRGVAVAGEVWSQGDSLLARMASLALVGDLTSVYLAEQAGIDAVPVETIEQLKQRLKEGNP